MANEQETETPEVTDTNTVAPVETPETQPASQEEKPTETPEETVKPVEEPKLETVPQHVYNKLYGKMKHMEKELAGHNTPTQQESNTPQEPSEPNWEQYEAEGRTVEQFNADYIKHQVNLGIEANKQQEAERADTQSLDDRYRAADMNFSQKMHSVTSANPDFQETHRAAVDAGIQFSPEIDLAIREAPKAGELFHHLLKNHQVSYELMRLSEQSGQAALVHLGTIMATLPTGNSQPALNLTKANPPPNPISDGGNSQIEIDENSSIADFQAAFPD